MGLTIISHFYNEEYLLPWWCNHHKRICDDAIMIDYGSTDKSVEIISQICPDWKIVKTINKNFDAKLVDKEVEFYESTVKGWRVSLNITEFLYGNIKQLKDDDSPSQKFLGNYVFITEAEEFLPDPKIPLHEQCVYGYKDWMDRTNMLSMLFRSSRSIHNKLIKYPKEGGRHYPDEPSFYDLWIFYYGFCSLNDEIKKRKIQIQDKMSDEEKKNCVMHPNNSDWEEIKWRIILYQRDMLEDLSSEVDFLSRFNYSTKMKIKTKCTNII